ncbi:MAG: DCC1-like thiol-disulfide oxidoreductase family protein [Pyrinomonadaceae bacterium]
MRKRGFGIAPLQSAWVGDKLGLSEAELIEDLRLLFRDGRQLQGTDVYRYLMARIWWAYPIYLLSIAPLLERLFDRSYRTFANNRFRFSHTCGLQGRTNSTNISPPPT